MSWFGFPDRLAHGVADILGAGFPDGLAHLIGASLYAGFPNGFAHGVSAFPIAGFRNILHAVDRFLLADSLITSLVAGVLSFFVNDFFAGLHDRIALLFAAGVIGCAAVFAFTQPSRAAPQ